MALPSSGEITLHGIRTELGGSGEISLIAASTPTPKDDVWIGKLYKLVDALALNIGRAKEK